MARPREFDPELATQEAMEAFWERGYAATSVSDLLAEMKLNRGSLYGTFGDKKQLFLAALEKYDEQHRAAWFEVLNRPGSAKAALREWVMAAAQGCTGEGGRRGCLIAKAAVELVPHDRDVAKWITRLHRRNEGIVASVVSRGQSEGEINTRSSAAAIARFLLAGLGGLRMLGTASPTQKDVNEVAELILRVLE